jgi:CRISPR-associated protein Csb1
MLIRLHVRHNTFRRSTTPNSTCFPTTKRQRQRVIPTLAQRGFVHVPAVDTHGGFVVRGAIYRDVTVNLVALRQLGAPSAGPALRRYVLGLALVAAAEPQDGFLRQGCLLTPDPNVKQNWNLVERDGRRREIELDAATALAYATNAAREFGVGEDRIVTFSKERAKADIPTKDEKKKKA